MQEEKGTTEDEMVGWHHRLDGCESWTIKKVEHQELMLLNCGVGEDS